MDILLMLAVLPAAVLLWFIYKNDPIEKEPTNLLVKLLVLGALSTLPAVFLEQIGLSVLDSIFSQQTIIYIALENFIVVAVAEECCKYFFLRTSTWNHPAFNFEFDGIVYAVFVSLGFAILENIMYVFEGGLATALVRAFTAIPGHAVFAVFMGYFYGKAKAAEIQGDRAGRVRYVLLALIVPIFCHGFYDFCASLDSDLFFLIFFVFLIAMVAVGMYYVKNCAKAARRFK